MNAWLWGGWITMLALLPAGWSAFRGSIEQRLAGLEMASAIAVVAFLMLARGADRPSFFDLPLALALLSFGGGMVFARFIQRWL